MTGSDDDDEVGYGKPPRHSQFRKGGPSPNPKGRPRKARQPENTTLPEIWPTRSLLRKEAGRLIPVRDGERRYEVPSTEAVLRALSTKAMQGGVLAARTILRYNMAEDERRYREKKERFDTWRDIVDRGRAALERAKAQGSPPPELLPHPDDVRFDYSTLEVTFLGAMNEAEARQERLAKACLDLCFELMMFYDECKNGIPTTEEPVFGFYTLLFVVYVQALPPRLRTVSEEVGLQIVARASRSRRLYVNWLEARCKELEIPFLRGRKTSPLIDLRKLGLKYINGQFV